MYGPCLIDILVMVMRPGVIASQTLPGSTDTAHMSRSTVLPFAWENLGHVQVIVFAVNGPDGVVCQLISVLSVYTMFSNACYKINKSRTSAVYIYLYNV